MYGWEEKLNNQIESLHDEECALEEQCVLNYRMFDFVNEAVSVFMPLLIFGLYVNDTNTLSLSAIVMTNMMISNI